MTPVLTGRGPPLAPESDALSQSRARPLADALLIAGER